MRARVANGRGLAEAGVLPNAGPGSRRGRRPGRDAAAIAAAARDGELTALYLLHADPVIDLPGRAGWEAALERATTVIAHANFLTDGVREHATVVFPAESYAEKDGTLDAPRRAPAAPARGHRPSRATSRAEWSVLADLARRVGLDLGILTGPMATAQLVDAVPFYAGLTLEEIGGQGVRWPARDAAGAFPAAELEPGRRGAVDEPPAAPAPNGRLRLGTFRSIWNATEVRVSPALHFLHPRSARRDGARRRPAPGALPGRPRRRRLRRAARSTRRVTVRAATPEGSVFLETNALDGPLVEVRKA